MSMIRRMCGVELNERKKSEEHLGLEPVSLIIKSVRARARVCARACVCVCVCVTHMLQSHLDCCE